MYFSSLVINLYLDLLPVVHPKTEYSGVIAGKLNCFYFSSETVKVFKNKTKYIM